MPPDALHSPQIDPQGDNRFLVRGELTYRTVGGLLNASAELMGGQGELILDLQGVERADSAGLALLLHWLREARGAGRDLRFLNLPEQLLAIARLSNLDHRLPQNRP